MDFEQSTLNSQCEEDCSLIHEQFHDVVPIQIDLENDEIETVADEQLKDGADNCSSKLKLIDEDEVETVADEQLKDGVDNCSSKLKLIYEVKNVEEPKEGMLFGSIEELHEYYRSYAKQEGFGVVQKKKKKNKDENVHYISLGCARQGKRQSSSSNSFCKPSQTISSSSSSNITF
ncbi:uncharacterized protein LOC133862945 isoform X1 [Alnus glutinosa]|uniref:uncharacterized protein LOC133862945 isoform X1 n=1 Tax=Alnus glutinosa TaxID=3517 RepID=UPI002D79427D|nr:uncharacterized protein LOC133862945 isoform X1 [Alnus glutinosa]